MASSSDRCFLALALELGLMPRDLLERALEEAGKRARPLERHLVETGQLGRDAARDVEVARTALARACTACRKVTYLMPGVALSATPCEHCAGALAPVTKPAASDGPKSAPATRPDPKSGATSKPWSSPSKKTESGETKSGPTARLSAPASAPPAGAPKSGTAPKPAQAPAAKADPRSGGAPKPVAAEAPKSDPKSGAAPKPAATTPVAPKTDPKSGGALKPVAAASAAPPAAPKPDPKSGGAPKPAAAASATSSTAPKSEPKSGPHAAPKVARSATEEGAPALVEDDEDWAPLPPWVGRCRIEALLGEGEAVFVYAGRIGDDRVAVRSLRPERVADRRALDAFFRAAQAAPGAGFEVVDLAADGAGVPFLAVRRDDADATLAERLIGLAAPAVELTAASAAKSDTGSLVFAQLQKQREELTRQVAECSRRRERCIDRFVLLEELGREAGVLWRAFDSDKDEVVLARVLDAGSAQEGGKLVKSLAETLTAAERLRNPQIASLRAYGVDGERLFLVHARTSASNALGAPTLEVVLKQAQEAAQALAYLHGQGLVHGGLHPGAVLVDGAGRVTLVDVGLGPVLAASGHAQDLPWRLARAGCAPLFAPESTPAVAFATSAAAAGEGPLLGGDAVDDVFALGALLFRAATPFFPDIVLRPAAPPDRAPDALAVALRCLAVEPAMRYPAMIDVARDLELVLEGKVPLARQALAPAPADTKGKAGSSVIGTLSGVFKRLMGR